LLIVEDYKQVDQPSATLNVWCARIRLVGIFPINVQPQHTVVLR
jgi:hypothetical protein